MMRWNVLTLALVLLSTACGGSDRPARSEADALTVAEASYDAAAFDTITWPSDSAAVARGSVVWAYSCQKCHGASGRGDGNFVQQGDTLRPPSLITAEWEFAADPAGIRRRIFTGGEQGMPHWGLEGLKIRDIDAVTRYILEVLRPYADQGVAVR